MRNKSEPKKRSSAKWRVTLTDSTKNRIDGWRQQMAAKFAGILLSDADFVNWFLSHHPTTLTAKQIVEIKTAFFDEVRELEWKLKVARAAKKLSVQPGDGDHPGPNDPPITELSLGGSIDGK